MSFILDALKKLEQKRQQDSVPSLTTIHTPNLHKPKKKPIWPYLLLIGLLINAGILTAWLRPWSSEVESTAVQTTAADTHEFVSAKEISPGPETASPEKSSIDARKAADTEVTEKQATPSKPAAVEQKPSVKPADEPAPIAKEKPSPVEEETASTESTPEEQVVSLDLTPSVDELENLREVIKKERELTEINTISKDDLHSKQAEDKPEREILELNELPAEVRKKIPDISINGHIYSSNSSSRLTNINGSLVREGDTVTGKLKVNEITMTGVIFDYDGLRFRVRAF
jgi:general secretion pathway protein B